MEKKKSNFKLTKKRAIVLAICAIILIAIIFGILNIISKIFMPEQVFGNNSITNMGLAVKDGNTVYYNKFEKGIFKVEGKKETQLTEETAYALTLYNDKIYYLTVSNSNTIDIKSVKTNGEENKIVKSLYTSISKFYIDDGYIYYAFNKDQSGIAKINLETGEEKTIVLAYIQDFVLDKSVVYYTDNIGTLHSVKSDGTDKADYPLEYSIKNIQIMKNYIYFYDAKDNELKKIKKNGTKAKVVATFVNNEMYNVTSKGIYYFNSVNKQICRCDLKGKVSKALITIDSTRTKLNIVNGIIYYLDTSKDTTQIYQMNRVKENGKATTSIEY